MEQTIKRKNSSNLYFFIYLIAGYGIVFTNNIYIFCALLLAIILKFGFSIKNGISIIQEWSRRKSEFNTLDFKTQRQSRNVLVFTYSVMILSFLLIVSLLAFRYNFWSSYLVK